MDRESILTPKMPRSEAPLAMPAGISTEHEVSRFGEAIVSRNEFAGFTHYKSPKVEVYLSDEVLAWGVSPEDLLNAAKNGMDIVGNLQFNKLTNLDPQGDNSAVRRCRTVNRITSDLGRPIAIKTLGPDSDENILSQYLLMRELQKRSEERWSEEGRKTLRFVKIYAAIKVGNQQFLFLEALEEAKPTFPELKENDWQKLSDEIAESLGLEPNTFRDLVGRNVLELPDGQHVIIDLRMLQPSID